MGIWDKIKNILGIAGNDGKAGNNIDQTEQAEAPKESNVGQAEESKQNDKQE